jgi:hypothetical protein
MSTATLIFVLGLLVLALVVLAWISIRNAGE